MGRVSTADPRAEYRRRLKHRQTTVIGGMITFLALLVIICLLVWFNVLPVPDPGFSSAKDDKEKVFQPCLPPDAKTTDVSAIPVNVYNGSDQTGLATGVADLLSDSGLTVANTTDWPKGEYDGEIELTTSQAGLANAYTLSKVFTGTVVVQIDETQDATDPTVSVVLGNDFKNEMLSAAEVAQIKPGEALSAPSDCVQVTTAPSASATATDG
ncbi:hypothetical protein AIF0345_3078 [Actinomyces israelii]|nr:hypothetical protein AIF0345_3078 [Actinomyces israelii]